MSGRSAQAEGPIAPAILDEAAAWLVQLHCGEQTEADRQACARWRQLSSEHAQAWERAERLLARLGGLPPELAMSALGRDRGQGRRRALKQLAMLAGATPFAWVAWRQQPWQPWLADRSTAVGELHESELPDGSQLMLNTDSAIDLRFDAERRRLHLLRGELLLSVRDDARPFGVAVAAGTLLTREARFSLRERGDQAHLVVLEGSVRVVPREGGAVRVEAGNQGVFDSRAVGPLSIADGTAVSWSRGMLMADRMPLAEFVTELGRYRRGVLRVAPELAELAVSGAFPVRDRDRSLAMLEATYSLRVRRLTSYWISLEPMYG